MSSGIFKLNWVDLLKGFVTATLTGLFYALIQNMDYLQTLFPILKDPLISATISAALGYLVKNLATDENNKLGGVI